jgi:hypothetical protein
MTTRLDLLDGYTQRYFAPDLDRQVRANAAEPGEAHLAKLVSRGL